MNDINPVYIGLAAVGAALLYRFWPRQPAPAQAPPPVVYQAPPPPPVVTVDPAALVRSAFQAFREVGEIRGAGRIAEKFGERQATAWEREFMGLVSDPPKAEAPKQPPAP